MAPFRIEVGRRQRVEPRQIVGALANEGGLSREDFGAIQIRPDFSIVELPADLGGDVLDRLRDTRISGKLIEIRPDRRSGGAGGSSRRDDGDRDGGFDSGSGDRPDRKPRRKY
jgi:ATP-dependent RNA helicase DeaD